MTCIKTTTKTIRLNDWHAAEFRVPVTCANRRGAKLRCQQTGYPLIFRTTHPDTGRPRTCRLMQRRNRFATDNHA